MAIITVTTTGMGNTMDMAILIILGMDATASMKIHLETIVYLNNLNVYILNNY